MIHQMLFTSLSRHPRGHGSDIDILSAAMTRNRQIGITGFLLRESTGFCQVIEGTEAAVRALFALIESDPRNFCVTQHVQRDVPTRMFPGWSMAYGALSAEDRAFLSRRKVARSGGVVIAFRPRAAGWAPA
ncbi:BLUF domain-containing protein [Salipiger marinus]|uniref:BLUF domain-containing protein n=1 Tax=Salipiger marinus TaxID=555512 RepID=UPI004057F9A7